MAEVDELAEETEAAIYADAAGAGLPTTAWKPAAVVRFLISSFSRRLAEATERSILIAKGGFLELAEGDWLTELARLVYGVTRVNGTHATSIVTVSNTGGGVYAGEPGDLVFINTTTSPAKTYRNTELFSIGALESNVAIPVEAVELGSASNAGPDEIDQLETTLLGVTVVGSTAAFGTDLETDAHLRVRCREKLGSLSPNGPRDAYGFAARGATDAKGNAIGVTQVRLVPDGIGGIDVYVATASGTVTGDPADPNTDLGAVAKALASLAQPEGVTLRVHSATALAIAVTYELWVRETEETDAELEEAGEDAIAAFLAAQPIGGAVIPGQPGRVYHQGISAAIHGALPAGAFVDIDVTLPAGDVDVGSTQAPTLAAAPTATIHRVSE